MIDIFITSFFRLEMTQRCLFEIQNRTTSGTYNLHVWDNGSDSQTQDALYERLKDGSIKSLHLDSRNTGCCYPKATFDAMATGDYYVVTDNDIYPPDLKPCWLAQMVGIMDRHPDLGQLSMSIPPLFLMEPTHDDGEVVYCKAVGNAFKLLRRKALPQMEWPLNSFGDDGKLSMEMRLTGWASGFCKNIFCKHAGQTGSWGYTEEQLALDPRKAGYGPPYLSESDPITYEPMNPGDRWQ